MGAGLSEIMILIKCQSDGIVNRLMSLFTPLQRGEAFVVRPKRKEKNP